MAVIAPRLSVALTHFQLVRDAANWLRNSRRCSVVAAEFSTDIGEKPDAMGWAANGVSILIECKTTRQDFLADAKKPHRLGDGVGLERWFYIPEGLVRADEVPAGWGLLEREPFGDRYQCRRTVQPVVRALTLELSRAERQMLVALTWRALQAASLVKTMTVTDYDPSIDMRAPEVTQ